MKRWVLRWSAVMLAGAVALSGCAATGGKPAGEPAPAKPAETKTAEAKPAEAALPAAKTELVKPPKAEQPPATEMVYTVTDIFTITTQDPRAKDRKVVMLTFDDGPSKEATARILDTLKEYNVKALFFVTGYGAKNRDLLERIHREGHTIGNHTSNHENLTKLTKEQMRQEIAPVNQMIEQITGKKPKYFRPPFGAYNKAEGEVLKEFGLEWMNWSVGSLDWETKDPKQVVRNVLDQVHPGANVLLHDTHVHTAEALPEIIRGLKEKGYEFAVVR